MSTWSRLRSATSGKDKLQPEMERLQKGLFQELGDSMREVEELRASNVHLHQQNIRLKKELDRVTAESTERCQPPPTP